jgi:hypothetical protein
VQWVGNGYWSDVVQRNCDHSPVWTITDIGQGWSEISTVPPAAPGRPEVMCMEKYWWQANMWNCHRPDWQLWQSLG